MRELTPLEKMKKEIYGDHYVVPTVSLPTDTTSPVYKELVKTKLIIAGSILMVILVYFNKKTIKRKLKI